ncbi:tetratricopeptide repeat protein [Flavobacterium cellulosilyticum]|uniref:Tetratricopeptide repeat protein n=1 Tax=Flavobacterium cellulosilyticum TaxID=2541731 RepID=A0A4R5CHU7_9FLAO|nr:tetratricopeptide repeat protein [Flavobacterium cellulosilyticum]TDD99788.1 tetratricopeptide repeat protein [Flavobacterium cellulosilyticum]
MKNSIYLFLLITQVFFAQTGFETGNSLYQKGQYEKAITAYESVLASNKQSAELYFNIGNCYYKLKKVAPSIYNYEKALLLSPDDNDIKNNLKFAQKLTIDEVKEIPTVGFSKMVQDLTSTFHYNTWAWISIGFSTLFLLFFIGYYFSQMSLSKRIFFFGMFVLLFLLLLSVSAAISEKSNWENQKPAIVFAEMVLVKSEPQNGSNTVFTLHEGTKVYILESMEIWRKIELTDGTTGWIGKNAIKEVKD